jgi:Tubulin like
MTPVLYIGLGSSGLKMLEEAQRFFYSTTKTCCPDHVRFLFVETDANKKSAVLPGQPHGRPAMEEFRTILDGVGDSIERLQRMVKVNVLPSDDPPKDAVVVLSMTDRNADRPILKDSDFPVSLYQTMSHMFSGTDRRMAKATAFSHLVGWLKDAGVSDCVIAVRLRGDRLEVYTPTALTDTLRLRVELLFNDVELATRLEKDKDGREIETVRWLPTKKSVAFADSGAGGMRSVGRIALWGKSTKGEGRYLQNFRAKIKTLVQDLRLSHGCEPIVYIAGTFGGGTNSGMFIDVAYLCRDVMDSTHSKNPPVLGLFLLPEVAAADIKTVSNSYACLNDLNHFTSKDSQFLARWPLDVGVDTFDSGTTPFKLATLMSLSWAPDGNLDTLCRMSGLFLFLMGSGFIDYRKARVIDVNLSNHQSLAATTDAEQENHWKYSAVGLTALFYPRGEIRVSAACDSAINRILASWLDPQHCDGFDKDGVTLDARYSERWPAYCKVIDEALGAAFARLANNGPGGKPAITELQKLLNKAARGEVKFNEETLREDLSGSSSIYRAARSFASPDNPRPLPTEESNWMAVEVLVAEINNLVAKEIDDTGNLKYGLMVLNGVAGYLGGVVDLWEKLGLKEWDAALEGVGDSGAEGILKTILAGDGAIFGVRREIRLSRLEDALRFMYIHMLTPHVKKLCQEMLSEQYSMNGGGRFPGLCTAGEIKQLSDLIQEASKIVSAHKNLVHNGIKPNALIKYVYPSGTFETEVESALRAFTASGASPKSRSMGRELVRQLGKATTLEALRACAGLPEVLAGRAIDTVTAKFEEASLPQPPPPANNAHFLLDNPELHIFAGKAVSDISVQMGRNSDSLDNAPTHPKVIVTDEAQNAQRVAAALTKNEVLGFDVTQSINAVSPLLKDMVLFFDERPVTSVTELAALHLWKPKYDERRLIENSLDTYFHT